MYILMHGNHPVVQIEIDNETGIISKVRDIYTKERIPVGVHTRKGIPDRAELNEWWESRMIPITRQDYFARITELEIKNARILALKNDGLSLSDHYWIMDERKEKKWSEINFYENSFSSDVGDIFCMGKYIADIDFRSPDSTSGGWLRKKWERVDDSTFLLKGSSSPFYQEALNEAVISNIYQGIGYEHYLPYTLVDMPVKGRQEHFSRCKNMTDIHTELIPAYSLYKETKRPNHLSVFEHLVYAAKERGVEIEEFLKHEIVIDYITNNIDRHLNNIAFIRNVDTLELVGIAPVFDSGTSLWLDTADNYINAKEDSQAKPFAGTQQEQMNRYVDADFLEPMKSKEVLGIIPDIIEETMRAANYDAARTDRIVKAVEIRVNDVLSRTAYKNLVSGMAKAEHSDQFIHSTEEDIAEKMKDTDQIDKSVAAYKTKNINKKIR